jgi:membrane protein DedA with SNARE-associated domain
MESLVEPLLDFVRAHYNWAIVIMFVTAFGESLVLLNLLFPGTALLIAAGALVKSGSLSFLPVIVGAVAGAVLGDAVSYWLGRRFGRGIVRVWPFNRHPELVASGIRFFARHGAASVFIGRFFGPIRAVIPLVAGAMLMPPGRFWLANIASALVWAPLLLFVGDILGTAGERLIGVGNTVVVVLGGLAAFGIAGAVWAALRFARSKT